MPRKPEPWYWSTRKAWFVQVDKKQVKLGADPDPRPRGKPKPPDGVMREYYRVMGASGRSDVEDRQKATVAEVCEKFLAAKAAVRDSSLAKYAWYLAIFAGPLAGREFRKVFKDDILRAAESRPRWGPTTKWQFVRVVVMVFVWARDAGYLDFNPLAGWDSPYVPRGRTRGMTDAEFTAIVENARDPEFKQMMMFLRGTGCRPGEMCAVTARHVHPDRPLVVLEPKLHKTGRKTGKDRVLVMPADVEVMVRALAAKRPKGPIFRNSRNGGPWKPKAIQIRFRRYREKLGLPDDVVPYLIRHAALTRLLDDGTPAHLAAKIAGHAGTAVLQSTYYHPDVDQMIAASNKANERKG